MVELHESLSSESEEYTVYLPISNWKKSDLPRKFGRVRFTIFSEYHLRQIKNDFKHHIYRDPDSEKYLLDGLKKSMIWNNPCAVIKTLAKDSDAALTIAKQEVRLTLDSVGWFYNLFPYVYSIPYMIGDSTYAHTTSVVRHSDHSFNIPKEAIGKGEFTVEKLSEVDSKIRSTYQFISSSLRTSQSSQDFSTAMVNACRWFGVAERSVDNASSFLNYVIGLESILLPETSRSSQRYLMGVHAVHLVGDYYKSKEILIKTVKNIYKIRNNIVHNGMYVVSTPNLNSVKTLAQLSIIKLSTSSETKNFKIKKQLDEWFEIKILSS